MAVILGKDVTITGISGARSVTVETSASEIDVTALGDSQRKFRKGLLEQTCEVECVENPGISPGGTFVLNGPTTGGATFICTNVTQSEPLDDIVTYTVSGQRTTPGE